MNKIKNKIFVKSFFLPCLLLLSFLVVFKVNAALVPCGLNGSADCTLCHLVLGFKNIYDYLLGLLLAATTLVIVVAGVMYMVSSGAKGMIDKAKSALTYALTAMILGLLAWLIINTVLNALGFNNAGSWWTFTCDTVQTQGPTTMGSGGATLPGNSGTGTGGKSGSGVGSYKSSGTLDPKTQKVIDMYIDTQCDKKYGGAVNCYSTTSAAYTLAGLPSLDNLGSMWQKWDGDINSIKPGDVIQIPNVHTALVLENGYTSLAPNPGVIGIYPDGVNKNIIRSGGNLRIIHIADVVAKYGSQ
jgi:hypothetical protein